MRSDVGIQKIRGFQTYFKRDSKEAIYKNILLEYFQDSLKVLEVFKNTEESRVLLVESIGGGGDLS